MSFISTNTIKFKHLNHEELVISLDRLSRFKLPYESYNRVFLSILSTKLISPKYSVEELENTDEKTIVRLVEMIWNTSVANLYQVNQKKIETNSALYLLADSVFFISDKRTKAFINAKLNIEPILLSLNTENIPINLKYLLNTYKLKNNSEIFETSRKFGLKFPIRKLLIVEGITEETLIPVFADKLGYNFDKQGIFVMGAGGKSKSPTLYSKLKDELKIPVVLLFDSDATEICELLKNNIIKKDKIIMLQKGEFEDILSLNLIKRTLNNQYEPATPILLQELKNDEKMCNNIENFYKIRNLGEFKKAKFSKYISENIKYKTDITEDIENLIKNIVTK